MGRSSADFECRRRQRDRGRRILCVMAAVFALAQLSAGLLFDHVWPQVRFPFLHRQLAQIEALPNRPTVVCLGSSRFGTCLIEQEMTRVLRARGGADRALVFNAAVPAGDLLASEHVLQCLLQRGVRPRVALIEISPEALNRHNGWMDFHVERQVCWRELPTCLPDISRSGEFSRLCLCRLFPLYAHRKGFWNFLGQTARSIRTMQRPAAKQQEDWDRAIGVTPNLSAEEKARITQQGLEHVRTCLRDYEPGGLASDALERILRSCREHGIRPLLIVVPVSTHQRELYSPEIRAAFQRHLNHLRKAHACTVLDCQARLADELFYDNHHASTEGGLRFSRWFAGTVLIDVD